ncbi:glycosyltransferase family 4 protein [Luteibacter sp. UNCMF366Tsu5.1]|uniref:glycosyltransferase family 4 protein n=1 Tax=Luteibacter sp. UNCMF366Tsu5.1 TaxID=1502758 RepID=UPI0009089402|nr:glycosyltransferase family 4 protein [Luteibacter sp. UNCMF366Tsu5.1]SFW43496.1 Glycosyltransferase involved in cell wall bisynthesis [Luteibacter sp. UNCMF366Tsu5.1]
MHVALINFPMAPQGLSPDEVLTRWPSLRDIADIVASAGTRVTVVQMAGTDAHFARDGVDYRFLDARGMRGARRLGRHVAHALAGIGVDLVHVHGLGFARHACSLRRHLPGPPILIQDHADGVPRGWRRLLWRGWYRVASGVTFTSLAQAAPFAALLDPRTRIYAIAESSSRFTPGDREAARRVSGLHGDPCIVSVGHLAVGKDPLTMLDGVARAAEHLPRLQLWCAFGTAPLMDEVRERIASDKRLAGRVHLLGCVPHAEIERLLRSADLFVSASRAEGVGYSLLEAMACGAVPVVTDIPAFREVTGDGRVGWLWSPGDAVALGDALVAAASAVGDRRAVREHFEATLSFSALGRRWASAYASLLAEPAA